ncbi:hypothetical protein AJ87_20345 [Rhizobium yanglingense]|nr:hypothetical protein AJ87_20345 [Rhizobium yanglingense]
MEKVHEEGLEDILAVVAEHQGITALLPRDAIKVAAAKTGTERAVGRPLRYLLLHDRIGIPIFDAVLHADPRQIIRQDMFRKVRLALVEIAGDQLDWQQSTPLQVEQQRQQTVGIFAA